VIVVCTRELACPERLNTSSRIAHNGALWPPVGPFYRYKTGEEAIKMTNETKFGLAA
jgi:acyl-CoA reductase-like NAD-dependent aldehyde dehydrogenase